MIDGKRNSLKRGDGDEKKDAPTNFGSHPISPIAENYTGFPAFFPAIAVAY